MKRISSVIMAVLATGAFAVAAQPTGQPHQQQMQQEPMATHGALLEKGFIKQGNKIFKVDRVTKATELEGLKVDEQGHILTKDGKRIELKDGQLVTPDGKIETFEQSR